MTEYEDYAEIESALLETLKLCTITVAWQISKLSELSVRIV